MYNAWSTKGTCISLMASFYPAVSLALGVYLATGAMLATNAQAGACPPEPGQGQLCTAKDFTITSAIVSGPTECTEGEIVSARVRVGLTSTANQRYDIGIFTGENGEPVFDGASCSLDALVPQAPFPPFDADSGSGGYRNLDGDACGDINEPDGEVFKDIELNNILCRDDDGDGQVDISGLVTWSSNANQDVCENPDDPTEFFPSSSSKCILDPDFNLPIIVEPPPSMTVFKLALPGNLPEPGGPVLFAIDVKNTSFATDTLTISRMIDDIHGDVTQVQGNIVQTSCRVPQTLVPGQVYLCEFVSTVMGSDGYVETDTITVTAMDDEGVTFTEFDQAQVVIGAAPPSVLLGKSANPPVIKEPGGDVTYDVVLANESNNQDIEITTFDDDLYGSLSGRGSCPTVPFTLRAKEIVRCAFTEPVTGDFGDPPVVDTITADGPDIDAKMASASVTIADVAASIEVTKTSIPASLPEPGGTFSFVLQVQNTSPADDVTIDTIVDDVYGDLNGQGTCATGVTLTPGEVYRCLFQGDFFGPPGAVQVDLITVNATDSDGGKESDFDSAEVFIEDVPSTLAVTKQPNVTQQISGGSVVYTVSIDNTSPVDTVTLSSLDDDPYGDITQVAGDITATTCSLLPQVVLPPAANYTCEFTATVNGGVGTLVIDTVSVAGVDDAFNIVIGADSAVVEIVDNSQPPGDLDLIVNKVAIPTTVPITDVPAPINYLVRLVNPNSTAIQITQLQDDIYDIDGTDPSKLPVLAELRNCPVPFALNPGESRLCFFAASANGQEGDVIIDVVTAEACELPDCIETTSESDDATVTITGSLVSIAVDKTANPPSLSAPGGPVVFTIDVVNTSSSTDLTITELVDDIYGDVTIISGDIIGTTCSVPQSLVAAGGGYNCNFTVDVRGVAGSEIVDIVTVTAEDSGGLTVEGSDSAVVEILGELPRVELTKTASPQLVVAPGGSVTFTASAQNTSPTESLTITSLVDDIYGDLNGLGTCSVPQVIPPTNTYVCEFPGQVVGADAGLHRDTIFLEGTSESGNPVADSNWAVVLILPIGSGGEPISVPINPAWLLATAVLLLATSGIALRRRSRKA
jgi:hypothetical protein